MLLSSLQKSMTIRISHAENNLLLSYISMDIYKYKVYFPCKSNPSFKTHCVSLDNSPIKRYICICQLLQAYLKNAFCFKISTLFLVMQLLRLAHTALDQYRHSRKVEYIYIFTERKPQESEICTQIQHTPRSCWLLLRAEVKARSP